MEAPYICMFVGIGFMILQTVAMKIQNPKKRYASLDDRHLFHTDSFNRRFAKLGLILGFVLPIPFAVLFGAVQSMPSKIVTGMICFLILAIIILVSTGMQFWQLAGISKSEIQYRKHQKERCSEQNKD